MELSTRPRPYVLPSYSLTSDILGFLRCGLQYRYQKVGKLPPSRPVQLWFGQFIHGCLEEAFREYKQEIDQGVDNPPPWPDNRVEDIIERITSRLAAQKLVPWDNTVKEIGATRAKISINELGPYIFPLIVRAEVPLAGTRDLPNDQIPSECQFREAPRYEISGIIDVLSQVTLTDPKLRDNSVVKAVIDKLPQPVPDEFEVIIDYKGMARPLPPGGGAGSEYWNIYNWQIQTYGHLRNKQPNSKPVIAGVIIYLNELELTKSDFADLKRNIREGKTDVVPEKGSEDEKLITNWKQDDDLPNISFEFRLKRAMRIVQITEDSISEALTEFDKVVAKIETCLGTEMNDGEIISSWDKNSSDDKTCTACDAKTFCPEYTKETSPRLPQEKIR